MVVTVTGCLQERDKLQNETISAGDMKDVFRMYGVSVQIPAVILSTVSTRPHTALVNNAAARAHQNTN